MSTSLDTATTTSKLNDGITQDGTTTATTVPTTTTTSSSGDSGTTTPATTGAAPPGIITSSTPTVVESTTSTTTTSTKAIAAPPAPPVVIPAAPTAAPPTTTTTGTGNQNNHTIGGEPIHAVAMKLLDLRLKPSTAIITAISGEFTASGQPELCIVKAGGTIEIHRIVVTTITIPSSTDDNDEPITTTSTVLKLICRIETRSVVRSCVAIRYVEEKRDVVAVGADGGAISILDFLSAKCKIVQCITFGKTACRRIVPGQYLATDPKGRALLIAAIEKKKLVYVINHDNSTSGDTKNATTTTLASPLEANRARTITYAVVGLDNGYDNPIFATIECQYPDYDDDNNDDPNTTTGTTTNNSGSGDEAVSLPPKYVAYYELDLGLNHVSRKWAIEVAASANCIVAVPGGATDGPGGVLIGCEDYIEYCHSNRSSSTEGGTTKYRRLRCTIPRRKLHPPSKGILITTLTVHKQKKRNFFILAQSELGDVYKVSLDYNTETGIVNSMTIALLDTVPTANALCISKLGMLFVASEFGNHNLYQFQQIDLPNAPSNTSDEFDKALVTAMNDDKTTTTSTKNKYDESSGIIPTGILRKITGTTASLFQPTILQNLRKIVTIDNPAPTTALLVGELAGNEVSPQIYTLTGRGPCSSLSITRHGAAVTELALTELPGVPGGIYTVADNSNNSTGNAGIGQQQQKDKYIVVSFADATLVLSIGDTVEEVGKESGLVTNAPTLACSALGTDGALCQVHPSGVRQIQNGQAKQWNCPGLKRIECASANEAQVLISLAGGEVVYFDINPATGALSESAKRDMNVDVCALDVGEISTGKSRSLFAAIACRDQTVRIVSLEPGKLLQQRSSTVLRSRPHSVAIVQHHSHSAMDDDGNATTGSGGLDELTLVIGLDDGSALRATIDPVTGAIGTSPTRRFLGARPVAVSRITLEGQRATLLLSSRPWISRKDIQSGKHIIAPLSFAPLDHGCSFRSDVVREGIVATAGKTLRILSVDVVTGSGSGNGGGASSTTVGGTSGGADDEAFNTKKVPLRYTPRQMTLLSSMTTDQQRKLALVVVESDYNEYGYEEKIAMGFDSTGEAGTKNSKSSKSQSKKDDDDDAMDMDEGSDDEKKDDDEDEEDEDDEDEKEARRTPIRGPVPPGPGHWGSCIRLLDPANNCTSLDCIELGRNEAALCCCSVRFHSKGGEPLLAVGTVTGMILQPNTKQILSSHILLYRIINAERFQLLHRTTVDDGPILALAHFQGRLLVGIGKSLRLYEMGKRQLLRKCELRNKLPTGVKTIQTVGDRAYVGDLLQSIQIIRYDATMNRLVLFASDPNPRPIVCQELLDWNTIAVGDKFGNISILRIPRGADLLSPGLAYPIHDMTGQRTLWDISRGGGEDSTVPKLELLCHYHVGEVVTGMTRASLVAGGGESLLYVTITGRIGALVPFTTRADVEFYTQLESTLREIVPRPTGRDPYQYRSYYAPARHVIDGDLCNAYNSLPYEQQLTVAEQTFDRTVTDIMKQLEDTRNALL